MPPLYRYQPEKRARLHRRGERRRLWRAEADALRKEVLQLRALVVNLRHGIMRMSMAAQMDAAQAKLTAEKSRGWVLVISMLIGWGIGRFFRLTN